MKNIILLAVLLFPSLCIADSAKVTFDHGWIKQLPPVVPVRAGYIKVTNPSEVQLEMVSLHSDLFESVAIHETIMQGGMMTMQELPSVILPPKTTVELKPGAKHIMFMNPKFPLAIGDTVNLEITFSDQKTQTATFEVKK